MYSAAVLYCIGSTTCHVLLKYCYYIPDPHRRSCRAEPYVLLLPLRIQKTHTPLPTTTNLL